MSNLYRSAISARASKLPNLPPISSTLSTRHPDYDPDGQEVDEEEGDRLGSLPGSGMGPPAMPSRAPRHKVTRPPNPAFTPLSASGYFSQAAISSVPSRGLDFRIYFTPARSVGHGGNGSMIVCHHGAGASGLTFACFAKEVGEVGRGEVGVLAFDARKHGKTKFIDDVPKQEFDPADLSIQTLSADLLALLKNLYPNPKEAPSLILVGHSMGGSVVTHTCPLLIAEGYIISGIAVLDVVEGSAMEALPHMHSLLNARPDCFSSPEEAIEWHISTQSIRNPTSARISVPSIIQPTSSLTPNANPEWEWVTTLRSTAPFWTGWFKGLSSSFISARTARLLILAGTDRLDKELMIGQMQGKFQMEVFSSGVGHNLQEDDPTRLAEVLVEFWRRNEMVIKGVKKVGDA